MTVGFGSTRTLATSPRRTWPPTGVSTSRFSMLVRLWRDGDARQQRGRGPAHVARLDPVALGRAEIDLDLHGRLGGLDVRVGRGDPVDPSDGPAHLLRLAA